MPLDRSHARVAALLLPALASVSALTAGTLAGRAATAGALRFLDISAAAGIDFVHDRGAEGRKHLPETMGAGVGWLDYDNDGRTDLYFVQSGALPGSARFAGPEQPANALYRNLGASHFAPVSSGAEDRGYGMGISAGDYDNDGWIDLFVSNLGPNALFRNNGDGTFSRLRQAILEDERWSVSSSWGDLDQDGFADLFVANYVVYDIATALSCGEQANSVLSYCHIDLFDGVADALLHNNRDGTFTDIASQAGVANAREGKGLGVVMGDFDDDGRTDVYVANDTQQNFMYINRGDGSFEEQGLFAGTGYSEDGKGQAGMGTESADLDGDGINEILVTNFAFEPNNLYRQVAEAMYLDETFALGIGEPGLAMLAFGIVATDADGDGDREVFVANGHILDNVDVIQDSTSYPQPNHVFINRLVQQRAAAIAAGELEPGPAKHGPTPWRPAADLFEEVSASAGPGFDAVEVSRGLATGDLDGDGRPDLAVNNSGGQARLLHNRSPGDAHRLVVRLRGRHSNRQALGARVTVTPVGGDAFDGATGFAQRADVRSTSSYGSQGGEDLFFGLGSSPRARVQIRWPGGKLQQIEETSAGRLMLIFEGEDKIVTRPLAAASPALGSQAPLQLVDATAESGLNFEHDHGGSGRRYMVETMGSGLALADLDGDGWLDAYFAQGSPTPGTESATAPTNTLFRGSSQGRFTPVPAATGAASEAWSMGVAVADYDNDGFNDLYVTNFGRNQMYRNNGDGTFAELAASARVDDRAWGSSAAWADVDNDGQLDLYVANYVDFGWDNHKYCGDPRRNLRAYCHPDVFNAQADRLYRNRGDGTFSEFGQAAGIADTLDGKGLGVVFGDANDDGLIDIYVANDSTRNFLYRNVDGRSFQEDGLLAGVSFSSDGQAEAGMGTDWGDYDGDGRLDVVVTNLDVETNSLYRNLGDGMFDNATFASGIGEPSLRQVGFGVNWMDIDNDADLDLFVANGHIIDNIGEFRDNITYAQRNHLFLNQGNGTLVERSAELGPGLALVKVSRGSAIGDLDNDGDLDIVVSNNGQSADLLLNQGGDRSGRWIQLRLVGDPANRGGIGARVELLRGGNSAALVREIKAGSSYGSCSDQRLHVGLGAATSVTVRIRWPGGQQQNLGSLQSNRLYVVRQGRGVIAERGPRRAAS